MGTILVTGQESIDHVSAIEKELGKVGGCRVKSLLACDATHEFASVEKFLGDIYSGALFLKPNGWDTGTNRGRALELILDIVTGKHYVFSS